MPFVEDARLNTIGISAGSAFSAPLFISTVRGTIAPSNNTFFEFGMDLGLVSNYDNAGYYSIFPYAHYNFFLPFAPSGNQSRGGWYIGFGGGYMRSKYSFNENSNEYIFLSDDSLIFQYFSGNIVTGFNIADVIDISYTFRSNFAIATSKLSVGYTKRFRTGSSEQ